MGLCVTHANFCSSPLIQSWLYAVHVTDEFLGLGRSCFVLHLMFSKIRLVPNQVGFVAGSKGCISVSKQHLTCRSSFWHPKQGAYRVFRVLTFLGCQEDRHKLLHPHPTPPSCGVDWGLIFSTVAPSIVSGWASYSLFQLKENGAVWYVQAIKLSIYFRWSRYNNVQCSLIQ